METNPGGGQYDLLSIFWVKGEDGSVYDGSPKQIGAFNLLSGTMHGEQPSGGERVEWLRPWLTDPDPKSVLEAVLRGLRLPPQSVLPYTNRRIFGHRLIAELLGANLVQRRYLQARMGFADTSGYGGGVLDILRPFTSIFRSSGDGHAEMRNAAECWLLLEGEAQTVVGAVRADGVLSSVSAPAIAHDLFELYERTKSMRTVVVEAQKILSE